MNDTPITNKIKARLRRYTDMLRDIDNQAERLDRMEAAINSPPGPNLSGMPRQKVGATDRVSAAVVRKLELEDDIAQAIEAERKESAAIEAMIAQLSDPDERAVIRLRYFDRALWDEITSVLFGGKTDYIERLESYQNRTYKLHGRALLELAAILAKSEGAAVKGSNGK